MSKSLRIHLRSVTQRDLPILFEHQRESAANEMAAFPARARDVFMNHWAKILSDENVVAMAVVVDRRVAGSIVCWPQNAKRLVGYWIGKDHWGKGVATQALAMFVRLVAERPLYAYVARRNLPSIRVLEKCRFVLCPEETDAATPADGVEELVYVLNR